MAGPDRRREPRDGTGGRTEPEPTRPHRCLAYRIAVPGFEFTLLEPPELVPHLRALDDRTLRAVEGHPKQQE